MNNTAILAALGTIALLVPHFADAQRAGQTSTIRYGTVSGMRSVDLNSEDVGRGVLVGGAVGAIATSSRKSSSRRWRNAAIGAAVGGAVGASNRRPGRVYTVAMLDGSSVQVATEQMEIRMEDCVVVEESGGQANIRRTPDAACEPASQSLMQEPDMLAEAQEEAAECAQAKEELVAADTDEQIDRAVRKIQILCYD